jgi:hypothetical protein
MDTPTPDKPSTTTSDILPLRPARFVAVTNLFLALLLVGGVWGTLPARGLPVDVPATLLALALAVSSIGLLRGAPWAARVARIVAMTMLVLGALLCTALAFTVAHISGLYGPVGAGGALLLGVVALLILPYLVVMPAAHLWLLLGPKRGTR